MGLLENICHFLNCQMSCDRTLNYLAELRISSEYRSNKYNMSLKEVHNLQLPVCHGFLLEIY